MVEFKDLKRGEFFVYDLMLYMRTSYHYFYNAAGLNGAHEFFEDSQKVLKVNCLFVQIFAARLLLKQVRKLLRQYELPDWLYDLLQYDG